MLTLLNSLDDNNLVFSQKQNSAEIPLETVNEQKLISE